MFWDVLDTFFKICFVREGNQIGAENLKSIEKGWDRKRLGNGKQTDGKRMIIFFLSFFYPFPILFRSWGGKIPQEIILTTLTPLLRHKLLAIESICF